MNKIIITGRLTRDPELRTSNSGLAVTNFSVAVDRPYAKEGDTKVDYMDCVAFRKTAEAVKKYFFKGKPILVEGRLQSRDWEDKNGMKRRSWEIIVDEFEFIGGDKKPQEETPVAPPEIAPVPGGDPFAAADGDLPF